MKRALVPGIVILLLAGCGGSASSAAAPASSAAAPASPASAKPAASSAPAGSSASTTGAAASTAAQAPAGAVKMAVSYPEGGAHLPLWYALDKGIFARNGLAVELKGLGGGPPAMAALTSGQTQAADITGSVIASADAGGADVIALATLDPVYPYVLEVPASVKSAQDLKGQAIAVRAFGDATDIAARVALNALGLVPDKDVKIVEVNTEGARMATVLAGKACCTVAQPQDRADLEKDGFHQLLDFTTLKNAKNAQGVIAVQRSYASSNKQAVQSFVNSVVQAIAAEKADKPGSIALIKKYLKVDSDDVANTIYDYFVGQVIPMDPVVDASQFTDGITILAQKNVKMKTFTMDKYVNPAFLAGAQK